jgi:hypothetical protein
MKKADRAEYVLQFLIVLPGTNPLVWRRLQVPADYSFWDLHVAIQDAMGWDDCHLHEFRFVDPKSGRRKRIGIPDDEMPDEGPCQAGWKVPIARYLNHGTDPVRYRYDFGDDWEHVLDFEDVALHDGGTYPRCLGGSGACPPEDVGGVHRYRVFLEIIGNRRHPEHGTMLRWAGGSFDPHAFNIDSIEFDDPDERWNTAFRDEDSAV